jgi:hypothetical protein
MSQSDFDAPDRFGTTTPSSINRFTTIAAIGKAPVAPGEL